MRDRAEVAQAAREVLDEALSGAGLAGLDAARLRAAMDPLSRAAAAESDRRAMAARIAEMAATLACEDREGWAVADEAFHLELVRLGGNERVRTIVANFNDQVRRARAMTLHMRPLPEKSHADHQALYDAIARGDADGAHAIHHHHRMQARVLLTGLLERHRRRLDLFEQA